MPGSFPKPLGNQVLEIVNFDDLRIGNKKVYCPAIGREAWGYIDYKKPLSKEDAANYELTPQNEHGSNDRRESE